MEQENLCEKLHNNPEVADVIFEVEGENIYGIKAMLKGLCPQLSQVINTGIKGEKGKKVVKIEGSSYISFKLFLAFILNIPVEIDSIDTSVHLLDLGTKFEIQNLITKCHEYLMNNITKENALPLYQESLKKNIKWLQDILTQQIFTPYPNEIISSESFQNLKIHELENFLNIENLDIDPGNLFTSCANWEKNNMGADWEGIKPLKRLLPYLRLEKMGLKQIIQEVQPAGILEGDTLLALVIGKVQGEEESEIGKLKGENIETKQKLDELKVLSEHENMAIREENKEIKQKLNELEELSEHENMAIREENKETKQKLDELKEEVNEMRGQLHELITFKREQERKAMLIEEEKKEELIIRDQYLIVGEGTKLGIYNNNLEKVKTVAEGDGYNRFLIKIGNNRIGSTNGNNIIIWGLPNFNKEKTLTGHTSTVRFLFNMENNNQLGSASNDCSIIIWDIEMGTIIKSIETGAYPYPIIRIQNHILLTNHSKKYALEEWDLGSGELIKTLSVEGNYSNVALMNNGNIAVATEGKGFKVIEYDSGNIIKERKVDLFHGGDNSRHLIELSDHRLISLMNDKKTLVIWNYETDQIINISTEGGGDRLCRCLDWKPDYVITSFKCNKLYLASIREQKVVKTINLKGMCRGGIMKINRGMLQLQL